MKKNYLTFIVTATLCLSFYSCEKQTEPLKDAEFNLLQQNLQSSDLKLKGIEVDDKMMRLARKLAKKLDNIGLRKVLKNEIGKRFDGDFDVLLSDLYNINLDGKKIKDIIEYDESLHLEDLGEVSKFLNVSIPANYDKWDVNTYEPLVAVKSVFYNEKTTKEIIAYDKKGQIIKLNSRNVPSEPVIVISLNERVEIKPNKTLSLKEGLENYQTDNPLKTNNDTEIIPPYDENGGGGGVSPNSGPGTGKYHVNQCYEYLTEINCTDINQYEGWIAGAPELRLVVHYKDFNENKISDAAAVNILMEPNNRSDINNRWWSLPNDQQLWVWDYQRSGLTQLYSWYEEDESISFSADKLIPLATNFKTLVALPGGIYTVAFLALTTSFSIKGSTEFIGQVAVDARPNIFEYGVGTGLRFRSKTKYCVENDQPIFNLVQ